MPPKKPATKSPAKAEVKEKPKAKAKKPIAPNYIPIGGRKVYVQFIKGLRDREGEWGEFSEDNTGRFLITLDASLAGHVLRSTLCHEMAHATLHISGISQLLEETHKGLEEAIVRMLEYMFFPSLYAVDIFIKAHGKEG
jgi:hypothetical protein